MVNLTSTEVIIQFYQGIGVSDITPVPVFYYFGANFNTNDSENHFCRPRFSVTRKVVCNINSGSDSDNTGIFPVNFFFRRKFLKIKKIGAGRDENLGIFFIMALFNFNVLQE